MTSDSSMLVSVVMPAYNASKYIGRAIESVLSQTYSNIELVIADDASTDNTCEIVEGYVDNRVKLIKKKINSGSAYIPRYRAFMYSVGDYVLHLDADDYLEPTYVECLMNRLLTCQADVCCGWMVLVDEDGHLLGGRSCTPKSEFDFNCQMTGKEAFFHTVPQWQISMNGCLAKREAWEHGFQRTAKPGKHGIHDDENVSRYILLWAKKVVFYKASHFYTVNRKSVTHVFNEQIFDFMRGLADLLQYVGEDFGKESLEYQAVEASDYMAFCNVRTSLLNAVDNLSDIDIVWYFRELKEWHKRLNWQSIRKHISSRRWLLECNYWGSTGLRMLKRRQIKPLGIMGVRKVKHLADRFKHNRYYRWYVYRVEREKMIRSQIEKKYNEHDGEYQPCVICIHDGTVKSGGLADRLRGIISVYAVCKEKNLPFRLHFTNPFDLGMFLEPNLYDWRIKTEEVCRDIGQTEIVVLDTTEDSPYHFAKQGEYLHKHLHLRDKQIHVFSNAAYSYTLEYAKLFGELFRPTPRLAKSLAREKVQLGENYFSVSARFLDLLGDFNETFGCGQPLSEQESENLIKNALGEIEKIHQQAPNARILVNSDSTRFLEAAKELPYTYVAPGEVTHIDNVQSDDSYEHYEKTFLDFLLIAGAAEIILLKSGRMHRSGYPYAASLLYARPFREVNF